MQTARGRGARDHLLITTAPEKVVVEGHACERDAKLMIDAKLNRDSGRDEKQQRPSGQERPMTNVPKRARESFELDKRPGDGQHRDRDGRDRRGISRS